MRKNVFTLLVLFLVSGLAASAQTEKGNWMVGGNIELNTAKDNTEISLNPSAGYFILNNLAVGGLLDLSYTDRGSVKTSTVGIGPFTRYYFGTTNIRPFVHGDVGYSSTKTEIGSKDTTVHGGTFFVGAGLAAFINRNVAIEGLAGYSHTESNGGFALKIGFQVYLSKRQIESALPK